METVTTCFLALLIVIQHKNPWSICRTIINGGAENSNTGDFNIIVLSTTH